MENIITLQEAVQITRELQKQGKKVVTTNGVYDLFHEGHLIRLTDAKNQGDVLIVGINSDKSIKEYKSPYRPIINENQRMKIIASLKVVDYVVPFDDQRPLNFLEAIKPDVHVNSIEYGNESLECEMVRKNGGRIHLGQIQGGFSTSKIIKQIKALPAHEKKPFTPCHSK